MRSLPVLGEYRSAARRQEAIVGFCFVLPALALYALFGLYPFIRTIALSLTDWDGVSATSRAVGLSNYATALHDNLWWTSLRNGAFFAVMALVFMNGLALGLALAVDSKVRGASFYRALFYLPTILSGIVVAIIWKWLYQPFGGPLNEFLKVVGLPDLARPWLGDSRTAIWAVSIASMWQGIGNPFLLFLAGLQGIPVEIYEAARIDGANESQLFRHIIIPYLVPVGTLISVLTVLGAMQIFNTVVAMTNGGPGYATEVPVLHIYREAFSLFHMGYATALAIIFGLLLFALSVLQLWLSRRVGVRAS